MLRKLKDAVPPNMFLSWLLLLMMVDFLIPFAHVVAGVPFEITITLQVLALIGSLWVFVRVLRMANKGQ